MPHYLNFGTSLSPDRLRSRIGTWLIFGGREWFMATSSVKVSSTRPDKIYKHYREYSRILKGVINTKFKMYGPSLSFNFVLQKSKTSKPILLILCFYGDFMINFNFYFSKVKKIPWKRLLGCLTSDHFLDFLTGPSISIIKFCSYSLSITQFST